ncbi:alpha/beta hydrolase family protein [Lacrimispora sp. AGF001]|uniref:alpha/beta hydrolase family protein n=1 Tax=Lacrimispora sp. AGF001 TaxID=3401631 RepID=UPI003B435A6A
MTDLIEKENYEILIPVMYCNNKINCVLHTNFNYKNDMLYILVPGLLGDRTDSRHMFVRLSRALAHNNCSILRFDYLGGGSSEGDYTKNDFQVMMDTLKFIIEDVMHKFPWFKKIGLIAFSEAGKICVKLSNKMDCIKFIGFCNAILVEEENQNAITRPKLINNQLVYDSNFGTWVSWNVVEQYKSWFISENDLKIDVCYGAVYSDSDPLTQNSLKFIEDQGIRVDKIKGADHLFTSYVWLQEMITFWTHNYLTENTDFEMEEFFLRTSHGKQCIRYIDKGSKDLIVFVHGVGQNKSGPGFLYNHISNHITSHNMLFFDFYGYGDSDFDPQVFKNITLVDYVNQLSDIVTYIDKVHSFEKLTLLGTGIGCTVIEEYSKAIRNKELNKIYLFPQSSQIWYKIDDIDKKREEIDTYYIYEKYPWAEEEFYKLGNVSNRIRGMKLPLKFLYDLYKTRIESEYHSGIVYITDNENIKIECKDSSCLLMSGRVRDNAISKITNILECNK